MQDSTRNMALNPNKRRLPNMATDANNAQERNKLEKRIAKAARRIKRGVNAEAEAARMLRLVARLNVINGRTAA